MRFNWNLQKQIIIHYIQIPLYWEEDYAKPFEVLMLIIRWLR